MFVVEAAWWWLVGLSGVGVYCLVFGYVVMMMFSCWFDCGLAGRWFVCCAGLLGGLVLCACYGCLLVICCLVYGFVVAA